MAKLIASRTYDRKDGNGGHDRIGVAEFAIESKSDMVVTLNGKVLPAQSVDHLMTFALQTLQDAYAGAEDATDAQARFDAKLERILEGTLGTRSGGNGVTEETRIMRMVLRPLVKDAVGKEGWKDMDEDARIAAIDSAFAGLDEGGKAQVAAAVETERKRIAAEAAAKAGLKSAIKISL